ncbi:MAG: 2-oxo acid dehydrogenase subunit E2 [Anaerolineae bacterium]|nr:2-oxo acid dehydrogenase subunit E2 [Anaerolineae bacterium]
MPIAVIMPKLEMSQETGLILAWKKKEGDMVNQGDALLEVETDKVSVDVEAVASGILAGVSAKEGESVPVTTVIAYLLQPGETAASIPAAGKAASAPAETVAATPAAAPAAAEKSDVRATPLAARMAAVEGVDLKSVTGSGPDGKIVKADVAARLEDGKVRATPAARRVAREKGVDLESIHGSGPLGRVQEGDVTQYASASQVITAQDKAPAAAGEEQVIPLKGMRRTIAERLQASYQTAPHIQFTARVDLTRLNQSRKEMNERAKATGQSHVSVTGLLVKAVAWTLMRHPWINSSLKGDEIYLHNEANIGVAVALPDGLIVPVVKQAQNKQVGQIAAEVNDLSERARAGKLLPSDVSGGTFTISNLGPYGIEQFTAIINPGQTGILAVGASVQEAVVVDGQLQVRPVMRMTLAVDHRVIDGAVAAQFMADLKAVLETPMLMLM